ncbi:leucine-rich repeat-containing protein 74B-like isoform X2 [Mizuhopecten yessoensis]|uniref:leucine-rich repeat-containing protein 74B-like isoform X2 n=1 Tax=Mizuhopecten yessoensis TaxID=6573 RepID=UPI000B458266|nr:leucine-rich repeat-containing protein 74B-like isoform X2 [Mizuhopecten yessoensis]
MIIQERVFVGTTFLPLLPHKSGNVGTSRNRLHFGKLDPRPLIRQRGITRDAIVIARRKSELALPASRDTLIYPSKPYQQPPPALVSDKYDDSDVSEELYISEDTAPPTPIKRTTEVSGLKAYLTACKTYSLVPITKFKRQLEGEMVSLKNHNIQGNTAKAIALALESSYSITNVDLEGSFLGPIGAIYIADILNNSHNITVLNLSGNKLMSRGLQVIVETMQKNTSLLSLDLSDNSFTDKDTSCLKDLLLSSCVLRELNLSKNGFEDSGGVLIAQGLAQNKTIKKLNLSWNHLRRNGAYAIGQSIKTNTKLEVLDVSWNGFDVPGCHGFSQGLDANTSLRELNISSNRIGPKGVAKLLEGLKRNTTLACLKLADNPLGPNGALAVLNAAMKSHSIEELDFGNQPVTAEFEDLLTKIQAGRDIKVRYGKEPSKAKREVCDETLYIAGNPLIILFEFIRMKKLDILNLFKTLDADSNHSISWEEFRIGVKKSHIPVRPKDLEQMIDKMDLDKDGEINFSELIVAQKAHNMQAEKLLAWSLDAFHDSPIGQIYRDLHKRCSDTNIYLKQYKLVK